MSLTIPERLATSCRQKPERRAWLEMLPNLVYELQDEWSLSLAAPFDDNEVSCSWVAPAVRRDGTRAVLKLGMPHLEGEHEILGLRFWEGDPTVRLLEADEPRNAMLLEQCEPGSALRLLPEPQQDVVISELLVRLWRRPAAGHPFRPLSVMIGQWASETVADFARWPDRGLVQEGLRLFAELACPSPNDVLLVTDLHAGNILQAQRAQWLVIDPKPFIGDPAYDATQHLFNCERRMRTDPKGTIRRLADLIEIDYERVRRWMFARCAAEPRDRWDKDKVALARALA